VPGELEVEPPNAIDETRHALDVAALAEADLIRINRDVDDLVRRVLDLGGR
jgi:translation initiation factor IF-3